MNRPQIVVTVAVAARSREPEIAARKISLYADAIHRHGGEPVVLDAGSRDAERTEAFGAMDGLLLTGGTDLHPTRYGQPVRGSVDIDEDRDELEAAAWAVADARHLPVLGICRGFQAMNVFAGGTLTQDIGGHAGPSWGHGPAKTHPVRIVSGSRLARILSPARVPATAEVNTYHHQGVRIADLAPGLVPNAWATSPVGDLVEGVEAADGRFLLGLQCHPERRESTPEMFERLWAVFVDACRGPADRR